jgi:hypothetical protein
MNAFSSKNMYVFLQCPRYSGSIVLRGLMEISIGVSSTPPATYIFGELNILRLGT